MPERLSVRSWRSSSCVAGASVVMVGVAVAVVMEFTSFFNTCSGELGIHVEVANDGVLVQQLGHWRRGGRLLEQAAQDAVAEQAVAERVAARPVHAFTRIAARQADQPLEQAIGAYAAVGDRRLGPRQCLRADMLDLAEQNRLIGLLARWPMQWTMLGLGAVGPRSHPQVNGEGLTLTVRADPVDAHQVAIPLSAYQLADQRVGDRVERALHLDVPVGM